MSQPSGTILNVNGEIVPIEKANVSVFDRSFLYGDSLYEVCRTYKGKLFGLTQHMERLFQSAKLCQMNLSQSSDEYMQAMESSMKAFKSQRGFENEEAYVRLVVSRGTGKIGFSTKNLETPTQYVVYVLPLSPFMPKSFEHGNRLQVSDRVRNLRNALDPAMKSGNYLNSLLAYLSAAELSFDDALMADYQGFITEGTTFNIFYVKNGIVVTPPLEVGILDGITRTLILKLCSALDIPTRVVRFKKEQLYEADEVFASSTIKEVLPVYVVDQKKIGKKKFHNQPGPITTQLKVAFQHYVESNFA